MTQSTYVEDEMLYINTCQRAFAKGLHYVVVKYNPDKKTMSFSFHNSAPEAGEFVFRTYGVEGLKSLQRGQSNIKQIIKNNSSMYGISTTPVNITFEFH